MPQIAVVILNWNGRKLLQEFLPSIVMYSQLATIYVADNASSDDSIAYIAANFPTVKIVKNSGNYGYAGGYNRALVHVEEPYLVLINSDVQVTENWLLAPLQLLEQQPQIAIIQPKILDYKNPTKFEYAGAAGGFIDKYGFPYCRGRVFDTIEVDTGQYDASTPIFWASGACFFIRKSVFEDLQGFDTDFFAHQEEIDLCWRAKNSGYQVHYCGLSTVYHLGGGTLAYQNSRKTYLNFRNSLYMLLKNLPASQLIIIIFTRLCMDGLAGIKMLLDGKPKHCWAVIHAHFSFYKRARRFYNKRKGKQSTEYYHTSSIVLQYFIKKRREFNNLI
ncbi:glycosyltransferase family 2 protein [Flavobacterium sp. JP2137]|uniref:glycosyltransferase family 2 protein n=1 Tax=Flavobacterium sp. JP2137 TaxID=3414510 RepID=UPI003D2FBA0B